MRHKKDDRSSHQAERLPPLFSTLNPVRRAQVERIIKNLLSKLKTDFVFSPICLILFFIPFKAHEINQLQSIYIFVHTNKGVRVNILNRSNHRERNLVLDIHERMGWMIDTYYVCT